MPDVTVLATPKAFDQLFARLDEVSEVLATYLGPALNKPAGNVKMRLIAVQAGSSVANVHFEVARTNHEMSDSERYAMQDACIAALQKAWSVIEEHEHVTGVKKVDGTATISRGTWGKVWEEKTS